MSNQSKTRYIPIIIAVSIVTGIFIGNFYASRFAEHTPGLGSTHPSNNKLNGFWIWVYPAEAISAISPAHSLSSGVGAR